MASVSQTISADEVGARSECLAGYLFCKLPEDKFFVLDENELCMAPDYSYPDSKTIA